MQTSIQNLFLDAGSINSKCHIWTSVGMEWIVFKALQGSQRGSQGKPHQVYVHSINSKYVKCVSLAREVVGDGKDKGVKDVDIVAQ